MTHDIYWLIDFTCYAGNCSGGLRPMLYHGTPRAMPNDKIPYRFFAPRGRYGSLPFGIARGV